MLSKDYRGGLAPDSYPISTRFIPRSTPISTRFIPVDTILNIWCYCQLNIIRNARLKMKDLVVKDNRLIQASYALSLVEQRLILMAIVGARSLKKGITPTTLLTINANDYATHFKVTRQESYRALSDAADSLFNRRATVDVTDPDLGITEPMTVRWVTAIKYNPSRATVTLRFGIEVIPLISRLEREFTSYEFQQITMLNTAYAVRIYEILKQWQAVGKTPLIRLSELKESLGIVDEYSRVELFKRRVLTPSLKQINEHTDITVDYEQVKEGAKIAGLKFTIKHKNVVKKHSPIDTKTIDIFSNLTIKQTQYFGATLANDNTFGSAFALVGESSEDFKTRITNELNDPSRLAEYSSHLKRLGLK